MEWIWLKSLPEQQKNGNRQRQKNLIWKRKTDEMTDAMERVNDSLDASGSQTEGEDMEEGPSLPDEENPFRIMQKIKRRNSFVVIPKGKSI